TLADKSILLGADNRPPIQHGQMILESVKHGPLIWPTIEENGVTRPKKYYELSATEATQADCDVKGETLRDFYLRFSLLLNAMNIYNVKLEQFQVNIKFLNTIPPEWSKFVTDVKLVRDLHTTNIDQLHAYLGQHEFHANEVRLMYERNSAVVMSRYPTTNNQLRNSSNLRQQATINDGRVTLQPIQGRQISFVSGTSRIYTSAASKAQQLEPKLYDGNVIKNTCAIVIPDSEDTLMLAEESHSKRILKQHDPMVLEKKNSMNSSDPNLSKRPTKVEVPKEHPKFSMSQEKDTIISKLKESIKSLSGNVNKDKLLRDELRKLKGKAIVDNAATTYTIDPEMLKINVEPIAPRLLNNRTVHFDYLRLTQEQAAILKEQGKS
nr:hypothetical protein [Tanacetum cinerariifolium]